MEVSGFSSPFLPCEFFCPRWSPDGKQIAFNARLHDATFNIYLISSEGGQAERILPSEQNQGDANWSPDGNSLVFGSGAIRNKEPIQTIDLGSERVSALVAGWKVHCGYDEGTPLQVDALLLLHQEVDGSLRF
jgi:dipeptidyl aminopeptidase/acylaminoacyl peptidase